jgi:hypothetical protein
MYVDHRQTEREQHKSGRLWRRAFNWSVEGNRKRGIASVIRVYPNAIITGDQIGNCDRGRKGVATAQGRGSAAVASARRAESKTPVSTWVLPLRGKCDTPRLPMTSYLAAPPIPP